MGVGGAHAVGAGEGADQHEQGRAREVEVGEEGVDAAIALVKTWPSLALPGVSVEIRPIVEDYSEFEQS